MKKYYFKAAVIAPEINLQAIAGHFGVQRKIEWDDTLVLRPTHLKGVIREPEDKHVYLFAFGGAVFLNLQRHEKTDIIRYLQKIDKSIVVSPRKYFDEFLLEAGEDFDEELSYNYMRVKNALPYHNEVIATVLAKSCALERTENAIDLLLDQTETVVIALRNGKLGTSDSELARMAANVLGFKLDTVSFVAILEKPEITWNNEQAGEMFDEMSRLFELDERYHKSLNKIETLKDITDVFTALSHARRGNRLEWAIIILISAELLVSLFDKLVAPLLH